MSKDFWKSKELELQQIREANEERERAQKRLEKKLEQDRIQQKLQYQSGRHDQVNRSEPPDRDFYIAPDNSDYSDYSHEEEMEQRNWKYSQKSESEIQQEKQRKRDYREDTLAWHRRNLPNDPKPKLEDQLEAAFSMATVPGRSQEVVISETKRLAKESFEERLKKWYENHPEQKPGFLSPLIDALKRRP